MFAVIIQSMEPENPGSRFLCGHEPYVIKKCTAHVFTESAIMENEQSKPADTQAAASSGANCVGRDGCGRIRWDAILQDYLTSIPPQSFLDLSEKWGIATNTINRRSHRDGGWSRMRANPKAVANEIAVAMAIAQEGSLEAAEAELTLAMADTMVKWDNLHLIAANRLYRKVIKVLEPDVISPKDLKHVSGVMLDCQTLERKVFGRDTIKVDVEHKGMVLVAHEDAEKIRERLRARMADGDAAQLPTIVESLPLTRKKGDSSPSGNGKPKTNGNGAMPEGQE